MKNPITLVFLFLLGAAGLSAQQISEGARQMSKGNHPALTLEITDMKEREVEKLWKNYLRSIYGLKPKKVKRSDDYLVDDAPMNNLGLSTPVDLYTRAEQRSGSVEFNLWIDTGNGFLSSSSQQTAMNAARDMLAEFYLEAEREKTRANLHNEEKNLKKLEKELQSLERDHEQYHKTIERAEKMIAKAKQDIIDNEAEQEKIRKEIESQKKVVKKVEDELNGIN